MANSSLVVSHILKYEGGHSADPVDGALKYGHSGVKGGTLDKRYPNNFIHTNRGITWGAYKAYKESKKQKPDSNEFINMSDALWGDIFKKNYWDKIQGDKISSQAIAEILVEAIWGGGSTGMIKAMQRFLNANANAGLVDDGKIGEKTIAALNKFTKSKANEIKLYDALKTQRMTYLRSLPTWWKYGNGWTNRVNELANRAIDFFGKTSTQIGGGLILLAIGGYFAYQYLSKNNIKIIS